MPSDVINALRKQLREKFPSAHNREKEFKTPFATTPAPGTPETGPRDSSRARQGVGFCKPQHNPSPTSPASSSPALPLLTDHRSLITTQHFPKGSITEISPAHPSCGLSLILAALLRENPEHENRSPLVLIDARDRFDPASFTPEECARLLWLRCQDTTQALRAADLLLRDGNLPRVLLDLSALPARELRRIPTSSWHRLRQLAETTDTTLLALTPTPLIPRTALRLTLTRQLTLNDLHLSRPELLALLQTQTTRHLHRTA